MLRLARSAAPAPARLLGLLAALAAALGLATPAIAQTFVQSGYAVPQTPQTTVSLAYSGAQTAGDLNVIAIGWNDATTVVQSVTDSRGNVYAIASGPTVQPGIQSQAIYYAANIASAAAGANTVTVTFSASASYPDLRIAEYSGVATTTPLIAGSGASGTSTSASSGNVNVSSVPALLVGAGYTQTHFNGPGSGYTQRVITSPDGSILEDRIATTTGGYTATGTTNGQGWVMSVAAFRAASGGGGGDTQAPTAPTGLAATAISTTQIDLAWNASTDNVGVTGYRVERCAGAGCSNFAQIATPTTTSYSDTGLTANTSYSYRVRAADAVPNLGPYSNTATTTTLSGGGGNPAPIAFVQARYAVPQTPQTSVTLAYSGAQTAGNLNVVAIGWSDSTAQVQSVSDSRGNTYALASGPTVQAGIQSQAIYYAANIASSAANTNAVTVVFNTAATFPDLRIAEYSGIAAGPLEGGRGASGTSALGDSGAVTTSSPSVLLVGAGYTESVFSGPGTGYTQRLITSPNGSLLEDRVVAAAGSYNATGSLNGSSRWVMQVAAFRAATGGGSGDTQAPTAPTLSATTISSTQIDLSWSGATDNVGVTGYRLERCAGSGCSGFTQIATPAASPYSNTSLASGTSYNYRVRAVDAAGNLGAYSNIATAITSGTSTSSISISSPTSGATLTGTSPFDATATGSDVAGVQFMVDNVKVGAPELSPPYELFYNTAKFANGAHTISAYMWDSQGTIYRTSGVSVTFSNGTPGNPGSTGLFSDLFSWPLVAVHVNLSPNGTVLIWDHMGTGNPDPHVWNPVTSSFTVTPTSSGLNIFCSGHTSLRDGRTLVAGGHVTSHVGFPASHIFDPLIKQWSTVGDMNYARWYPTLTALPDGRVLALAGETGCAGCNAQIPEIYDPVSNTWTALPGASYDIPFYPNAYVLPNGKVLVAGSAEDPLRAIQLDLNTQTWSVAASNVYDSYSSAMYLPGKIVKSGTSTSTEEPVVNSSRNTAVMDAMSATPSWRKVGTMAFGRAYHTLTLLPDGNVLVTGGGRTTYDYGVDTAVKEAEVWSPTTEKWTTLAAGSAPRLYHSTALLLPDATVLVSGGGRSPGPDERDQLNAEIFAPPYLFKGARPVIASAPGTASYNQPIAISTPDAARVAKVSLVALGNMTHGFNMNQRFLPLTFTTGAGTVTATAPQNANLAPPGWYMLFLVDTNGVPSQAAFILF